MEKLDARIVSTKKSLEKALLSLLRTKKVGEISVKELCDAAKISRGTFYLHFSSPIDVMHEIEDKFIASTIVIREEDFGEEKIRQNAFTKLFTALFANKDMSYIMFGHNGDADFPERVKNAAKPMMMRLYSSVVPGLTDEQLSDAYEYSYYGAIPLILEWHEKKYPLQLLAKKLETLGKATLIAIKTV